MSGRRPAPRTHRVRVDVPAKVNLHLGVGTRRADGYHDLHTVFHAVSLTDTVVATPADGLSIAVSGAPAGTVPTDAGNLAWQAAEALADRAGVPADVHLDITKRIPVAGGMAGGSADAAGALVACARLWGVTEDRDDLKTVAATLGSDTAFVLLGATAIGLGRGELVTPVPTRTTLHWVFATTDFGISASAAYATIDRLRADGSAPPAGDAPDGLLAALAAGDVDAVAATLSNDLQPAALALAPQLRNTLAAGARHGALAGIVSGSGPTCAFLCADQAAAVGVAARLTADGIPAVTSTGPAPGARVVP